MLLQLYHVQRLMVSRCYWNQKVFSTSLNLKHSKWLFPHFLETPLNLMVFATMSFCSSCKSAVFTHHFRLDYLVLKPLLSYNEDVGSVATSRYLEIIASLTVRKETLKSVLTLKHRGLIVILCQDNSFLFGIIRRFIMYFTM